MGTDGGASGLFTYARLVWEVIKCESAKVNIYKMRKRV